jgi:diguanylate cyclase (GGDEF)-like protein
MSTPGKAESPLVLLVTSSKHTANLIKKQLAQYFIISDAKDAEAAWGLLLEQQAYSLVICELGLSINPFGLLERIRKASDNQLANIPFLLLFGENESDEERKLAFRLGASDFVSLPCSSAELIARASLRANFEAQNTVNEAIEMQQLLAAGNLDQLAQVSLFNSLLKQEVSFSQRHRSNFSVVRLHIDNLKAILTGFDQRATKSVVKAVARIITKILRREDTLSYLGKADFCILYPATNGIGATNSINRILSEISKRRILLSGKKISVTLSVAIYGCIADENSSIEKIHDQLIVDIEKAISNGGNQIVNSSPAGEKRLYSVDRALRMIESKNTDDVAENLNSLVLAILP